MTTNYTNIAGEPFGYADPNTQTRFAYAMNKSGYYFYDEPREHVLSEAVFECIKRL